MTTHQTNELDTALGELGLQLGKGTELGGADGGEVIGVREEDGPLVADELVEADGTIGGLGIKVRGNRAQTEAAAAGQRRDEESRARVHLRRSTFSGHGEYVKWLVGCFRNQERCVSNWEKREAARRGRIQIVINNKINNRLEDAPLALTLTLDTT